MEFELLRGVNSRLHLIDCRLEAGTLYAGAAYLPPWLKETEKLTDGSTVLEVKLPESLSNQSSPSSCVDLKLELS